MDAFEGISVGMTFWMPILRDCVAMSGAPVVMSRISRADRLGSGRGNARKGEKEEGDEVKGTSHCFLLSRNKTHESVCCSAFAEDRGGMTEDEVE